jgi:hypothetical protein
MEAPDVWIFENLGNIVVDEAIRQGVGVWQDRKERENYDCQDSWFSAMAAIEEAPPSYKLAHDGRSNQQVICQSGHVLASMTGNAYLFSWRQ